MLWQPPSVKPIKIRSMRMPGLTSAPTRCISTVTNDAAKAYDQARKVGLPQRMLRYQFGPFLAYFHSLRTDDLLTLTEYALKITPNSEEAMLWRGWGLFRLGKRDEAVGLVPESARWRIPITRMRSTRWIISTRIDRRGAMPPFEDDNPSSRPEPQPENQNGLKAFDTLSRFLEEDGWHPRRLDDRFSFTMNY